MTLFLQLIGRSESYRMSQFDFAALNCLNWLNTPDPAPESVVARLIRRLRGATVSEMLVFSESFGVAHTFIYQSS